MGEAIRDVCYYTSQSWRIHDECTASIATAVRRVCLYLQCYKSVCFELEKASKKVHKKQRLNVLYIISDICRKSQARLGSKDKYGKLHICSCPHLGCQEYTHARW